MSNKIIGNISHVVVAVKDLKKAEEFFSRLFDTVFTYAGENEAAGFKSMFCENNLELISPTRQDSNVARFIETKGEGVYAVGFGVSDAEKARLKAESMGIRVVGDITAQDIDGGDLAGTGFVRELWLHPKDVFGVYLLLPQIDEKKDKA